MYLSKQRKHSNILVAYLILALILTCAWINFINKKHITKHKKIRIYPHLLYLLLLCRNRKLINRTVNSKECPCLSNISCFSRRT